MSVLLETSVGDFVLDLDTVGSPRLCENFLKLCKARYYTNSLVYNVTRRFCQAGDPTGTGRGGGCIYGLLDGQDIMTSQKRFMMSQGRRLTSSECKEKGRVVATELQGVPNTIGSQFLITLESGEGRALDGYIVDHESDKPPSFLSLGTVVEDKDNVLDKIASSYCDSEGRPYADIRIIRSLVVHDPFDDPPNMSELMRSRGVEMGGDRVVRSPSPERPVEESVSKRISITEVEEEDEQGEEKLLQREERTLQQEDKGRAVVLEMLGDLPDADIKAPENVLFICKLNPVTVDEDLELIFSRFDEKVKVEIIRDHASGKSLQYAFAEFSNKQQAVEAYFKMNNALIDDRRIKVDFSQSVAKIWDKFNQKMRMPKAGPGGNFSGDQNSNRRSVAARHHDRRSDERNSIRDSSARLRETDRDRRVESGRNQSRDRDGDRYSSRQRSISPDQRDRPRNDQRRRRSSSDEESPDRRHRRHRDSGKHRQEKKSKHHSGERKHHRSDREYDRKDRGHRRHRDDDRRERKRRRKSRSRS